MGAKAQGFHPVAPRCVRATRWGRASVTQGGLVSSIGKVWLESCDTRRRKGEKQATPTISWRRSVPQTTWKQLWLRWCATRERLALTGSPSNNCPEFSKRAGRKSKDNCSKGATSRNRCVG